MDFIPPYPPENHIRASGFSAKTQLPLCGLRMPLILDWSVFLDRDVKARMESRRNGEKGTFSSSPWWNEACYTFPWKGDSERIFLSPNGEWMGGVRGDTPLMAETPVGMFRLSYPKGSLGGEATWFGFRVENPDKLRMLCHEVASIGWACPSSKYHDIISITWFLNESILPKTTTQPYSWSQKTNLQQSYLYWISLKYIM